MVFSKRELKSFDVFMHLVEKPHNTSTTQIVSSIIIALIIGSSEQNNKQEFYDLLIWPSILCLI